MKNGSSQSTPKLSEANLILLQAGHTHVIRLITTNQSQTNNPSIHGSSLRQTRCTNVRQASRLRNREQHLQAQEAESSSAPCSRLHRLLELPVRLLLPLPPQHPCAGIPGPLAGAVSHRRWERVSSRLLRKSEAARPRTQILARAEETAGGAVLVAAARRRVR